MNKKMLMLMANSGKGEKGRRVGVEYEDWGVSNHYPMTEPSPVEDKFRDRRGREHYDNGRYAPESEREMWVESAQRRGSDGRYIADMHHYPYMPTPYVPPVYERGNRGVTEDYPRMRKIGFSTGEDGRAPSEAGRTYRTSADYPAMNETAYRRGTEPMSGYASGAKAPTLTPEMAREWVSHMENADGTTGAHWTMEQTENIREKHGIDCDPVKFWVALNATYSDLSKVFQKHNINNIGAYTDFAVAFWLKDQDAVEDKLAAYYTDVVEH